MRTLRIGLTLFILLAFVTACNQTDEQTNNEEVQAANTDDASDEGEVSATTEQGDFRVDISSAKKVYEEGEPVDMQGALTYIGEQEEMEIMHAMSPTRVAVIDHKRNFYMIPEKLDIAEITTLSPGESISAKNFSNESGIGMGLTPMHDENQEQVMQEYEEVGGYPAGAYTIMVLADFSYETAEGKKEFVIPASINIVVEPS